MKSLDTGKSLRKTGISPSGEIPSCPHNALLEILSRNHARVVPDGYGIYQYLGQLLTLFFLPLFWKKIDFL